MPFPFLTRGGLTAGGLALGFLAGAVDLRASFLAKLLHKDVDVITVTDVTEKGKALAPATPAQPVRYKMIYVGEMSLGLSWSGESLPSKLSTIRWMMEAMKAQGYLLADELHPPEQLFVFGWGMLGGGQGRSALRFLGGEKVDLMWEQEGYNGIEFNPMLTGARVLTRGLNRMGVAGKVWDFSESNLFMGMVQSYTMDSETSPKPTKLWETRFACPANGLALDETMPLLIKTASLSFGRETTKPVSINATDYFGGRVDLGELKFLGEGSALTKPKSAPDEAELK